MTAITPASNQYAGALSGGIAALTPGSIMLLLRRRMSDMDGQIDSIMGEIESNTAQSEKIQEQVEAMTAIKAAMANQQPEGDDPVALGNIDVTWKGEDMSAADLLNRMGIDIERERAEGNPSQAVLQERLEGVDEAIAAIEALEEGNVWRTQLPDLRAERAGLVRHHAHAGNAYQSDTVTGTSLSASIDRMQSEGRRMNSGNEVLMVRMQSAMQQRSQSVTMATQMLKSINDSSNSIAQNIGR
ncbi:MAG: hypothetical protein AB8H86_11155 [Polyangiales bacterium]